MDISKVKFESPIRVRLTDASYINLVITGTVLDFSVFDDAYLMESYEDSNDKRMIFVCSCMPDDIPEKGIFFEEIK